MTQKTKLTAANGQWVGKKTMMRMEEFIDEIDLLTLLPECKELEFIIHRTMNVPDMPLTRHTEHGMKIGLTELKRLTSSLASHLIRSYL